MKTVWPDLSGRMRAYHRTSTCLISKILLLLTLLASILLVTCSPKVSVLLKSQTFKELGFILIQRTLPKEKDSANY